MCLEYKLEVVGVSGVGRKIQRVKSFFFLIELIIYFLQLIPIIPSFSSKGMFFPPSIYHIMPVQNVLVDTV